MSGGDASLRSQRLREGVRPALVDTVVVAGWFALSGLVAALVWNWVTPLAEYTRTADNGTMGEQELARQFSATGWYFVIAAVVGLAGGLVLLLWRRRGPVRMVLLVALGGALAAVVMARVGLMIGPDDPQRVLPTVAVGDKVPLQLEVEGFGVYFTWSIAALLGALIALWSSDARRSAQPREDSSHFVLPPNSPTSPASNG